MVTGAELSLPAHLADATTDDTSLRRFLFGLPGVDPVGIEQRAAALATRSIKKASKLAAIDLAISMVDLTTLEGADTPGKVRCSRIRTGPTRRGRPRSACIPTWRGSRSRSSAGPG
jgi:deoxyribose-phosphate aldolase